MAMGIIDLEPAALASMTLPAAPASRCPVDAGGVRAEWIELTAASPGQPTLVCFPAPSRDGVELSARLAAATGARVLNVDGCSVDDGVSVWAWLLHEGCDPGTTTFVGTATGGVRAFDVLVAARRRGLVLPDGGVWTIP